MPQDEHSAAPVDLPQSQTQEEGQALENWAPRFADYYPDGARETMEFHFSSKLVLAARNWVRHIDAVLQEATGQNRARWQTLFTIGFMEPPVTTITLATRLGLRWPSLVRTLGNLEADGLIERLDNPADGRSRFIQLTDKGRELMNSTKAILDPERSSLLTGFTDEELDQTAKALDRFFRAVMAREEAATGKSEDTDAFPAG
ncbi:MAG TPA: MarR family transcriptional regulator [Novosphingobium sp.]|nr:MarR family transcriptional regulator [Novosphingobium sp.]